MARHIHKVNTINGPTKSPKGLWSNPEMESLHKTQEKYDIKWKQSGEATTCNKSGLTDHEVTRLESASQEDSCTLDKKNKNSDLFSFDNNKYDDFHTEGDVINESFSDFMRTKSKNNNSKKHFMYDNKEED